MEKNLHHSTDPEAILHLAQEFDHAAGDNTAGEQRPTEKEPPQGNAENASAEGAPPQTTNSADTHKDAEDESDDDPGLVARMTAKGALSGF